jgi:hypothetical protein
MGEAHATFVKQESIRPVLFKIAKARLYEASSMFPSNMAALNVTLAALAA